MMPSQSHPLLITLPYVLTAMPRRSSGNPSGSRRSTPAAEGLRFRPSRTSSGTHSSARIAWRSKLRPLISNWILCR